ncbi:MAG: hypothetical protein IPK75_09115 [Acidobacteria bacterium]|jgi:hypothetical protein|nr:hypothetical protein [Acidobacteriota bacterium]
MIRGLIATLFAAGLLAATASAQVRARDNAVVSASVLGAREALDACGGRDLLDVIVPDGPFLDACKFHDACYRSGALDQGVCDADFLADMREACDAHYDKASASGKHAACEMAAYTYYRAVNSRFGSMLYPRGVTEGQFGAVTQTVSAGLNGTHHLEACAEARNASNRKLRFFMTLHDAKGKWVATAPGVSSLSLQPGESKTLCAGTSLSWFRSADNIGAAYALTLKVDDPSTLNPFGDLIDVDRMDCETDSGTCRRVTR